MLNKSIQRFIVPCSQKQFNLKQPALSCTLHKGKIAISMVLPK